MLGIADAGVADGLCLGLEVHGEPLNEAVQDHVHLLLLRDLFYRAFTSRLLIGQFERLVKASATAFELPRYG